jgi:hypothetical protein
VCVLCVWVCVCVSPATTLQKTRLILSFLKFSIRCVGVKILSKRNNEVRARSLSLLLFVKTVCVCVSVGVKQTLADYYKQSETGLFWCLCVYVYVTGNMCVLCVCFEQGQKSE